MSASRLCYIVSAILFVVAGLIAGGFVHVGLSVEMLALFAFALWVGGGAV